MIIRALKRLVAPCLCGVLVIGASAASWAAPPEGAAPADGTAGDMATDPEVLLRQADEIFSVVQDLRAVTVDGEVARAVTSREDVLDRILEIVEREVPNDLREAQDRIAVLLGIVGPQERFFDVYMGLLQREVAGFYDDVTETFFILDDTPIALQAPVMAHELFHAVQDLRWGIAGMFGEGKWVTDVALAAQALIEGDALAVMAAYAMEDPSAITRPSPLRAGIRLSLSQASEPPDDSVPPFLWEQLVFPYVTGLEFVFALVAPDDWSAVDAVYDAPPRSTEQVLHPERYRTDAPTWLTFDASDPVADRYMVDVFGEFAIGSLLRQLLADVVTMSAVERAVEGWDGDRLEAWRFEGEPGRDRLVWLSVWDSEGDAEAFAAVASRLTVPWLETAERVERVSGEGRSWSSEVASAVLVIERWGDLVLLVHDTGGPVDPTARRSEVATIVERVWDTHARSRYPTF